MFIMEDIGKKSQTYKEGTFSYMSEEMKSLGRGERGLVDLYYNDVCGLKNTISYLKERVDCGSAVNELLLKPTTEPNRTDQSLFWLSKALLSSQLPDTPFTNLFYPYFKKLNPSVVDNDFD